MELEYEINTGFWCTDPTAAQNGVDIICRTVEGSACNVSTVCVACGAPRPGTRQDVRV